MGCKGEVVWTESIELLDLWIYGVHNLETFQPSFFQVLFVPPPIPSVTSVTCMCEVVPQVTEALFLVACSCLPTHLSKLSAKIIAVIKAPQKYPLLNSFDFTNPLKGAYRA